jgi:hypothetical protein
MSTINTTRLEETVEKAVKGLDLAEARQAADEVDRIRESNRQAYGSQDVGVSIIREFRGPLPE